MQVLQFSMGIAAINGFMVHPHMFGGASVNNLSCTFVRAHLFYPLYKLIHYGCDHLSFWESMHFFPKTS